MSSAPGSSVFARLLLVVTSSYSALRLLPDTLRVWPSNMPFVRFIEPSSGSLDRVAESTDEEMSVVEVCDCWADMGTEAGGVGPARLRASRLGGASTEELEGAGEDGRLVGPMLRFDGEPEVGEGGDRGAQCAR